MTQDKRWIMAHLGDSFFQKGKAVLLYREKMEGYLYSVRAVELCSSPFQKLAVLSCVPASEMNDPKT